HVAQLLRDHSGEIIERTLAAMKADRKLGKVSVPDQERIDHLPKLLDDIAKQLETGLQEPTKETLQTASEHGRLRKRQAYPLTMVAQDASLLDQCIYTVVQDHLLSIDLSSLVPELRRVNASLDAQLEASLQAYAGPTLRRA